MNIYAVGGAIRDELLGVPVVRIAIMSWSARRPSRWWRRAIGPSARIFPCSCIRITHEEYALARTERKTAAGLSRLPVLLCTGCHARRGSRAPRPDDQRDGARMRPDGELIGPVIDPFDGRADLEARCSAMSAMRLSKTRCGFCASRGLPRASRISPSRRKRAR